MGDIVPESRFHLRQQPAEIRKDPILDRWSIISPERARRVIPPDGKLPVCPFCAGNEEETLAEVEAIRPLGSSPNDSRWLIRVVPNLYPALRMASQIEIDFQGLFEKRLGSGNHEVIIECPHHETSLAQLSPEHLGLLMQVWKDRLLVHRENQDLRYGMIFKNQGTDAGASLEHCHSQLLTLPMIPGTIREELDAGEEYFSRYACCLFCELLKQERDDESRVIWEDADFVAFAAYAGRFPFETWIFPKSHHSHFEDSTSEELNQLGSCLHAVLKKLQVGLHDPPLNIVLQNAPLHAPCSPSFHWHLGWPCALACSTRRWRPS